MDEALHELFGPAMALSFAFGIAFLALDDWIARKVPADAALRVLPLVGLFVSCIFIHPGPTYGYVLVYDAFGFIFCIRIIRRNALYVRLAGWFGLLWYALEMWGMTRFRD